MKTLVFALPLLATSIACASQVDIASSNAALAGKRDEALAVACTENGIDHPALVTFFEDAKTGELTSAVYDQVSLFGEERVALLDSCKDGEVAPGRPADAFSTSSCEGSNGDVRYQAHLRTGGIAGIAEATLVVRSAKGETFSRDLSCEYAPSRVPTARSASYRATSWKLDPILVKAAPADATNAGVELDVAAGSITAVVVFDLFPSFYRTKITRSYVDRCNVIHYVGKSERQPSALDVSSEIHLVDYRNTTCARPPGLDGVATIRTERHDGAATSSQLFLAR